MQDSTNPFSDEDQFLAEHREATRRFFLAVAAGSLTLPGWSTCSAQQKGNESPPALPAKCAAACEELLKKMEYLTPQEKFGNVSRGNPHPYKLPEEKKRAVGLTRETWKLEVVSDPEHPARIRSPLQGDNALTWNGLMELAKKHAISIPKIMTCITITW